jgi:hypothetical protein
MRSLPSENHRSDERAEVGSTGEHNSNGVACEMQSETEEGRSAIAIFNFGRRRAVLPAVAIGSL